jgi:hypothetical protein
MTESVLTVASGEGSEVRVLAGVDANLRRRRQDVASRDRCSVSAFIGTIFLISCA